MNNTDLLLTDPMTVDATKFITKFETKYRKWGMEITNELKHTWKLNCQILNHVINHPTKIMKYVVSAPTGSAKTENLITYCSMLPNGITALIATNLTNEADKIARNINKESTANIACSFHSKTEIDLTTASKYQIVVTTHAFYKKHYAGSDEWFVLVDNRNLLVIDEALDTMKEISVEDMAIARAILIFSHIGRESRFNGMPRFLKELQWLKDDLNALRNANPGTNLISSDRIWTLTDGSEMLSLTLRKYIILSGIMGEKSIDGESNTSLNKYGKNINYNYILTGVNDRVTNKIIKEALRDTINNLNELKDRQVYITSNNGNKSFNRVTNMIFRKPLVCFDATANVNNTYSLRAKYYNDITMIDRVKNIRNYSNVTMHTIVDKTGKQEISLNIASNIMNSVALGKKTLIITHLKNETSFEQIIKDKYPKGTIIKVAHWNALTGLNNWDDFDTCIIAGLNHKPIYYSQNRTIINTDTEETAFGNQRPRINTAITDSTIVAEIIQAINRIRIRKVTKEDGGCDEANIYIILPFNKDHTYINEIKKEMTNIKIKEWKLESSTASKEGKAHSDIVIRYLKANLKTGDTLKVNDVRDKLGINKNSYKSMLGNVEAKKQAFKDKLHGFGYEITESTEGSKGRKRTSYPIKYFRKI
jgi:hypothetical protein